MVSIRGRKLLNSVQKGPKNIQAACLSCQNFYRNAYRERGVAGENLLASKGVIYLGRLFLRCVVSEFQMKDEKLGGFYAWIYTT